MGCPEHDTEPLGSVVPSSVADRLFASQEGLCFQILKGYDDGVNDSELLSFRTLFIFWNSKLLERQSFGNWICCPSSGEERKTTTLLGPLERANLNRWSRDLC
jgi:hypothetical protein